MNNFLRILKEYRFIKTANVIYNYQNLRDKEHEKYKDGETVFIERCFAMDVPKKGDALIREGYLFRVGTIWHNRDENCIEVDLNDL